MRSSSLEISVPLPTPDGPVITNTFDMTASENQAGRPDAGSVACSARERPRTQRCAGLQPPLPAELGDELCPLALGKAADRLRGRNAALVEDAVGLDSAVLRYRQQHVEDLGGHHVLGRIQEQRVDARLARFQILLELGAGGADVVGPLESVHPLVQ